MIILYLADNSYTCNSLFGHLWFICINCVYACSLLVLLSFSFVSVEYANTFLFAAQIYDSEIVSLLHVLLWVTVENWWWYKHNNYWKIKPHTYIIGEIIMRYCDKPWRNTEEKLIFSPRYIRKVTIFLSIFTYEWESSDDSPQKRYR